MDVNKEHRYAIIPGIFQSAQPARSHTFVQVFDGNTGNLTYHQYPLSSFKFAKGIFDIWIGPNHFTAQNLSFSIESPEQHIKGDLQLSYLTPWPVTLKSPGIMGWYAWAPFMQCYHGVVSMDHLIEGNLQINHQSIDFSAGRGYTEKDWGRSFPESWVWFQCNHFAQAGVSLTASIAIIPWIRGAFPGFIIGLWKRQKLYRFATYTGAQLEELSVNENRIAVTARDRNYRLEMLVARSSENGILQAPSIDGMDRQINESLDAKVEVCLSAIEGHHSHVIYQDSGYCAGLEAVGDLEKLMDMWMAEKARV